MALSVFWVIPLRIMFFRDCLPHEEYSVFGFFLARGYQILKSKHSFPLFFLTVDFGFLFPLYISVLLLLYFFSFWILPLSFVQLNTIWAGIGGLEGVRSGVGEHFREQALFQRVEKSFQHHSSVFLQFSARLLLFSHTKIWIKKVFLNIHDFSLYYSQPW